jgi:hypothetical protein
VERVFQRIEAMPLSFPVLREDDRIRRAVVRYFPYVVYFVPLSTGEPRVIAVAHGAPHVLGRSAVGRARFFLRPVRGVRARRGHGREEARERRLLTQTVRPRIPVRARHVIRGSAARPRARSSSR